MNTTRRFCATLLFAVMLIVLPAAKAAAAPSVTSMRVPDGGVQPEAAGDATGAVHLIYLKGNPAASDVFYARSADGGATWSEPVRINSEPGSAVALGTVRGAHLALGANDRLHVAWMGSAHAQPRSAGGAAPMLYARSSETTTDRTRPLQFEPQRNVIAARAGVDGGGSVAADGKGNVYVAWHAPQQKGGGEADRRVWVAISVDEGKTFAPEVALSEQPTGACGCCGMDVLAGADGRLYALYRAATEQVNRDIYLTASDPKADHARSEKVAPTHADICLMSTAMLTQGPHGVIAAWETRNQVQWGVIDPKTGHIANPTTAAGANCKHPALAVNAKGEVLVAWAEGTGWNRGGSVAWQVYDAEGKPIEGASGKKAGLPAWGKPAAFAKPDGSFVVLY